MEKKMLFKDALQVSGGLRYVAEHRLKFRSSLGRRYLYETSFEKEEGVLEQEYEHIAVLVSIAEKGKKRRIPDFGLSALKDISGTLARIEEGYVLDDIGLYEVKMLAALTVRVRAGLETAGISFLQLPDLCPVVNLLDPEKSGISRFYIYDAYSEVLKEIRRRLLEEEEEARREALREQEAEEEDRIRTDLAKRLRDYSMPLRSSLEMLASLDVKIAKAEFACEEGLCCPRLVVDRTFYRGLFHPEVKEELEKKKQEYQAVDVSIEEGGSVITGANMSGKSVLLKALALAQYLAQFGFWVPAVEAEIVPVDMVCLRVGDEQDERKGLSSYAAEMLRLNELIGNVKEGKKVLALVDEPARTTNPAEGRALVDALLGFMGEYKVLSMVTTHYGGIRVPCRRLRMRGFREDWVGGHLSVENINSCMDYSLLEEKGETIPREALKIAEILGVDADLIEHAKKYLESDAKK